MDDLEHLPDEPAQQWRLFQDVFRATWQEALGRQWPNLAGDVEVLCEQAFTLGVAHGRRRTALGPVAVPLAALGHRPDGRPVLSPPRPRRSRSARTAPCCRAISSRLTRVMVAYRSTRSRQSGRWNASTFTFSRYRSSRSTTGHRGSGREGSSECGATANGIIQAVDTNGTERRAVSVGHEIAAAAIDGRRGVAATVELAFGSRHEGRWPSSRVELWSVESTREIAPRRRPRHRRALG